MAVVVAVALGIITVLNHLGKGSQEAAVVV
jgi:hypothetical protein